jgi:hypothetical protein
MNINLEQLKNIYGNKNIIATYTLKFLHNYPINDYVTTSYIGPVDNMPIDIGTIIDFSKTFQCMAEIFKSYHEQLPITELDNRASPLNIKLRIKAYGDIFTMEYNFVLDYNKNYSTNV